MKPIANLIYFTFPAAMLIGCGTTGDVLPYRAPDPGQPSVQLTVSPPELSRHDSEQLSRHDVKCQANGAPSATRMGLTDWRPSSKGLVPKVFALPTGRVYFRYVRNGNSESCVMNFSALLEAGHAYGIETERTYGGFFKKGQCLLKMVDSITGEPVPLDHESAEPNFRSVCNKQLGNRGTSVAARN